MNTIVQNVSQIGRCVCVFVQLAINQLTDLLRVDVAAAGFTEALTFALVTTSLLASTVTCVKPLASPGTYIEQCLREL